MWRNTYKDYRPDSEWIKKQVEPGQGIVGCEMHELNGWGNNIHRYPKRKEGWLAAFLNLLFKKR